MLHLSAAGTAAKPASSAQLLLSLFKKNGITSQRALPVPVRRDRKAQEVSQEVSGEHVIFAKATDLIGVSYESIMAAVKAGEIQRR